VLLLSLLIGQSQLQLLLRSLLLLQLPCRRLMELLLLTQSQHPFVVAQLMRSPI
jgi:hypothetical protein